MSVEKVSFNQAGTQLGPTKEEQASFKLSKEFFKIFATEMLKSMNLTSSSAIEEDFLKTQLGDILAEFLAINSRSLKQSIDKALASAKNK